MEVGLGFRVASMNENCVKTQQNHGASAEAPSCWQRPPAQSPMRRTHGGPFEECWAGLVDSEGHSGERKGTMTMGGGELLFC